jgi:hypothetical protein
MRCLLALPLLLTPSALAQENKAVKPAATQREIDDAVKRGVAFLKAFEGPTAHGAYKNADELILLTLIHALSVPEKDEEVQKLLKNVLDAPLEKTYKVALQAMCLEELDRVTFQWRIAQCAQFLVDNQAQNGQWSYGSPTTFVKDMPSGERTLRPPAASKARVLEFDAERVKPPVQRRVSVKQQRKGGAGGDNSNSQYASLGLRACFDAGVDLPAEVVQLARKWWVDQQHADEGAKAAGDAKAVASGADAIRGWNYTTPERGRPTPAMTAGAVGAVCIYDHIVGVDWKKDPVARAGVAWLGKHFTVGSNYYYMYGLERAGMLYGTDTFGPHAWYPAGARFLVGAQNADGSWGAPAAGDDRPRQVWDTCFAILFLKKATRAIATEGSRKK